MTTTPPPLPNGFTAEPDQNGGWRISRAGVYVARIFPRLPDEPDGLWYARLYGKPARPCRDRQAAVDHIIRHVSEEKS